MKNVADELDTYRSMLEWAQRGIEIAEAFRRSGQPVPRLLESFVSDMPQKTAVEKISVHPPTERPFESKNDWIWVPKGSLSPTALSLGVLHNSPGLTGAEVHSAVSSISTGNVSAGTVYNLLSRMKNRQVVQDSEKRWELKSDSDHPVLSPHYGWGSPSVFSVQEVAAHRRLIILYILENIGPMRQAEIQRQLETYHDGIPVSKELIKADLIALESESKIRKNANTRDWSINRDKNGGAS